MTNEDDWTILHGDDPTGRIYVVRQRGQRVLNCDNVKGQQLHATHDPAIHRPPESVVGPQPVCPHQFCENPGILQPKVHASGANGRMDVGGRPLRGNGGLPKPSTEGGL
jgi:hypothetical protein